MRNLLNFFFKVSTYDIRRFLYGDCLQQVVCKTLQTPGLLPSQTEWSSALEVHTYLASHANDELNPDAACLWATKLPSKVKFLGWLLYHGRLNTRASLNYTNIRPLEGSYCEQCTGTRETDDHISSRNVRTPLKLGLALGCWLGIAAA